MHARRTRRYLLLALLLSMFPLPAVAGGAVFWLGGGGAPCNFGSLPIALGAVPQGATIRIADNQTYANTNLTISNRSVTLQGGWADCAGTPSAQRALIEGAAGANLPVLRIQAAGTSRSVRLEHLEIRGGTRSGIEVDGLLDVRLDDTLVTANSAADGGGVSVTGVSPAQTVLRLVHSTVGTPDVGSGDGNAATFGGGVYCADARVQLSSALVQGNHADYGGGIALLACDLDAGAAALVAAGHPLLSALVRDNTATFFGGGLYATNASDIGLDNDHQPVAFEANRASRGGGIHLSAAGTRFHGAGITLAGNSVGAFGAAAYVESGAYLALERGADGGTSCARDAVCSRIVDNAVDDVPTAAASALQVIDAVAVLAQTEITGNVSHSGQALIRLDGSSGVRVLDSLVHDNDAGAGRLFVLYGTDNVFTLGASTVVANATLSPMAGVYLSGGAAGLHFDRSIVWQPGVLVQDTSAGETVTSTCMNVHAGAGIDGVTSDPGFVDAAHGDLRLRTDSPNVDACTDTVAVSGTGETHVDVAGHPRPQSPMGSPTPFDRGAHELADLIFADGFDPPPLVP
ncbi:putative outer membrane repeat protein [Dokdonella fugitiva]|uniref:Putative outer membrane repeat protein n=1 Tax=Dokdonella fugitiva TaxID=328517 RepID=A0A839F2L8_9GAMM|nr:hypothetical protein [Dokdonella fugitiva]MBA8888826.1 putative outer membrane repeat protein [Dokdonella fugitiva]